MQTITPELKNLLTQLSQQLQNEREKSPPLLEIWDAWVEQLDLPAHTQADHYATLRRQISKAKNPSSDDITWFTELKVAAATFNKKLGYLKSCGDWAKSEGLLVVNPWLKVRNRKGTKEIIKPFSKEESVAIVAGFEKSYPTWVPFTKFLFLSGCRLSEAIGLRWGHVDFERGEVCICESLAQRKDGNSYERVRKSTKTGSVRFLKINSELAKIFEQLSSASQNSEDLVFLNPAGTNHMDANNFRDRWKKVLSAASIPYRRPHIIRHSFASHAIDQGCPLTGVAYLLGHSDTRMVASTYGHLINRPSLPSIL
ncbi:site-specific integrase [Microcoleus sp. herbarium7]|uniref:tyrosine-type recombinase/integrase n=1 Tax=Microcoleus sp. herbarium7 TaxID=3055435 RepID=UPI002FD19747